MPLLEFFKAHGGLLGTYEDTSFYGEFGVFPGINQEETEHGTRIWL